MKNIGLQLYSIRQYTETDFAKALERVAAIGYTDVEFAGYFGIDAKEMRRMLDANGLRAISTHTNVFGDLDAEIAYLHEIGAKNIVCPGTSFAEFENEDTVKALAERMNKIGEQCKKAGLQLGFHNHTHEFRQTPDGRYLLDVLYANTDPSLLHVQLDVCWAYVAGVDPVEYLKKYQDRLNTVHAKEVLTVNPYEGTAVGDGVVDFKGIYGLLGDSVTYIVEQEGLPHMETWEGVTRSLQYLKTL